MKSIIRFSLASMLSLLFFCGAVLCRPTTLNSEINEIGEYTLVVEGFDWGPAVSKVILSLEDKVSEVDVKDYTVAVKRSTDLMELPENMATGNLSVVYAYVSDHKGNNQPEGKHLTLVLQVAPNQPIGSPMQYTPGKGNQWIDFKLTITNNQTKAVWKTEAGRIHPLVDRFDLSGKYVHKGDLTMSYASYTPEGKDKRPLIIWLHGGGEGGTDPTIPLLANRAANYASDEIQAHFGGAYVLVPQSPTFWMQNAEGNYTTGKENDVYNEGLMALIQDFVANHPNIDADRIYVGGCSNGGYMSLKLVLLHPDYFAAAFPSALAYQSQYITDEQIISIKDFPFWFVHSKDDPVTVPDLTVVPLYHRLIKAGATKTHFSYYDHVTDITGFFGGPDFHYHGHFSWIYCHANRARLDFDGSPVTVDGRQVTIMEWLAAQKR